jgi:hypothetical protein
MRDWPPITEPELLERLALDDDAFFHLARRFWSGIGPRECDATAVERALGYPWERPAASYVLAGEDVRLLDDLDPDERAATVRSFAQDRHPLLAYGGNGAPSWLSAKFAHFTDEPDRTALVLAGRLHDFDVGPAAAVSPMGYMPATLLASPGTAVRASIVWATAAQVTQLTWSEVPYRLVRLDDARFVMDAADGEVEEIFAYVHRLGSFCVDEAPVAMAAVPASGRSAAALTQEELLDVVATLVIGSAARAEHVIRAMYADLPETLVLVADALQPRSQQLQARWTGFPDEVPPLTR